MDRHLAASLDHWLTTPPEECEPDISEAEADVRQALDHFWRVNQPENGDSHEVILAATELAETVRVWLNELDGLPEVDPL